METFTLADIKSDVRGLLTDDSFDGDLITQAANWFQNQLFTDHRLRMAETSDTITALQAATEADFPEDMLTRIAIWATVPRVYNMKDFYEEYDSFMLNYANFATASQGQASAWTEFGKQMRFSQPLNAAHTFQIDYLRAPEQMEDDGDDCELSSVWRKLMAKGTLIGIMEINEDYEEADTERDNLDPLITSFVKLEGRGGGKTGPAAVMRTNRGRGVYRADRDF